jgi:hypothetical protein
MNYPPGVAKVDPVDELKHNESDLLLSNCVFVLRQELFEIELSILKH